MCTGIEIALLVGAGIAAAGTAYSAVSQAEDAKTQAHQMELDAQAEEEAAQERADIVRKQGAKVRGAARAAYAAAGVEVDDGTPIVIDQSIGTDVNHDAWQEILYGKQSANRIRRGADATRRAGAEAARQGYFKAASTLMGGAASYYRAGWGSNPPPEQAPAPIYDRSIRVNQ